MNEIKGRNELDANQQGISHQSRVTESALNAKLPKRGEGSIAHYRGPKQVRKPARSSYHNGQMPTEKHPAEQGE